MVKQTNQLGYGIISDSLHNQLYPNYERAHLTAGAYQRIQDHYNYFEVELPVSTPKTVQHDWILPKLQGGNLRQHFSTIAQEFAEPYDIKVREFIQGDLPPMPAPHSVLLVPGWTMYLPDGSTEAVDHPLEDVFVLDCETYVLKGAFPIIATCVSPEAWYIWLDPALCDLSMNYVPNLYSIGSGKLLLGHNATYDFQRSVESHWVDPPAGHTRNYFICSMAMNITCNGFAGPQRWVAHTRDIPWTAKKWAESGCANSLVACYNFHCWPSTPLGEADKEMRNMFVTCHLPEMRANFVDLIQYALLDVQYTFELFQALYPVYRQRRNSWVSLAGSIQQSAHNLPVVDNWHEWVDGCESKLGEYEAAIDKAGRDIADGVYLRFKAVLDQWQTDRGWDDKATWATHNSLLGILENASVQDAHEFAQNNTISIDNDWLNLMLCPWLGHTQLDWSIGLRNRSLRGSPEWRRKFKEYTKASRQLHMFLKITTRAGQPVVWGGGVTRWHYLDETGKKVTIKKPGGDGIGIALLNKDHAKLFEDGSLMVTSPGGEAVLKLAMATTYWTSCRGRVKDEIVVPQRYSKGTANVICPSLVPTGTVSGRGVSPLWLTVTDCKPENNYRIGVELKSRVQAPPGYKLMSADMSAQELRVASTYADSIAARSSHTDKTQLGYIGASLMSHGLFAGNKELGTDPHTMLAKSVGVSRSAAKGAGYAVLYGAGVETVANSLMFDLVKNSTDDVAAKKKVAIDFATKIINYKRGKMDRATNVFYGGTDSAAFTVLTQLAARDTPRTPLLKNILTAPMCPINCGKDFMTGRVNWGIQSTARDQGDCLMVAYQWLCDKHNVNSRVIFLLHDEYVALTAEEDIDIAAWLFNVAHVWTWAYLNEAMAVYDMCDVGIWFEDVLVQDCMRKAANLKTNSASNPDEVMPDGRVILEWELPRLHDLAVDRGLSVCPEIYQ